MFLPITYNGNSVIVDMCNLMKLLFELGVLACWPIGNLVRSCGVLERVTFTYCTPPGCKAVLFTLLIMFARAAFWSWTF
jgi:hypothetical protein